jgi:hypothetical protein
MLEPLRPQPGSTIDPRNAVGRQAVTARARNELLADNNLCVNDPRRMGKTVWLDVFCDQPGEGFDAVKIDFEGVQTVNEFLLRAVTELRGHRSLPNRPPPSSGPSSRTSSWPVARSASRSGCRRGLRTTCWTR